MIIYQADLLKNSGHQLDYLDCRILNFSVEINYTTA